MKNPRKILSGAAACQIKEKAWAERVLKKLRLFNSRDLED
jgi:hypothetical protein